MTRLNGTLNAMDPNGFAKKSSLRLASPRFGRWKLGHAALALLSAGMLIIVFAFLFVAGAAAQQQSLTVSNSNDIMGFETYGTWSVKGNSSSPGFIAATTTNRTQGNAAYSVADPPNMLKLTSQPIASTATALAGIGDAGAQLQIDILIPEQQGNAENAGYIQPYVSSKSRGLSKVPLSQVFFNSYHKGIYSTLSFPVPTEVGSALKGGTFSDLTFELDISSPGKTTGTYLLDNLRVHSVTLVQSPTSDTPIPPGYGGSVDLVVYGDAPVTQSFNLGPTQIPEGFHLKMGTHGASTVQLELGLDGSPAVTCTYDQDGTDSTMQSYILQSCTNGSTAGDLVNADWVHISIVGGDHTQKIRAQLALNPMGDLIGGGILPPMPTFWGDADTCIPHPVAGTPVTISTSCANQTAQANQIINQYFTQLKNANPPPNWIVPPVPEFALRHGDGTPNNNLLGVPPPPHDPPFDSGGDLNPGGSFDAYWRLNGNLTPTPPVAGSDDNKTHFDAAFTAHGVLFGEDIDVVDAKIVADTDSGQTTPTFIAATSTGSLGFYVFGVELPAGQDITINPSTGFSYDKTWSQEFDLPPINIWIFSLTLGANADAELKANGSAAVAGVDLVVTPSASLGGHIEGGINLGIANGGVDAKINLLTVSTPATAQAKWVINTSPLVCATTLNGSLKGDLNLASLGGEVDLKATFGVCPLCDTESQTLFKWGPLASSTLNLFNDTIDVQLFGLPASLCVFPSTATITSPTSGATLSSGLPITLTGTAAPNDSTIPVSGTTFAWTYTPGTNAGGSTVAVNSGGTGANPNVTFPSPTSGSTSTWTIGMSATVTTRSASGTTITSTASATSVIVTVANPSNGVAITQVTNENGQAIPDVNGVLIAQLSNPPQTSLNVFGTVTGASGVLNTTFTVVTCTNADYDPPCIATSAPTSLTVTNATTTTPSASGTIFFTGHTYKITMHTTVARNPFGTDATVLVWVPDFVG